jgi:hypothetical protein
MTTEHIKQISDWLYRLTDGLSEAWDDARAAQEGRITHLGADFSFLHPNLSARGILLASNPHHRYDLASRYIYDQITLYRPAIFGYQLVFSDLSLLKMLYHYSYQSDSIEQILSSRDVFDTVRKFASSSPMFNGDPPTAEALAEAVDSLIADTKDATGRLEVFHKHLKNKRIVGIGDVFDRDLLRRSWSDRDSFEAAYSVIDNYRYPHAASMEASDVRFLKTIDTLALVSTKQLCNNANTKRYRYLGWTRGRGFFGGNANNYYRLVLSPFYRLATLMETPHSDDLMRSSLVSLEDRRDQARLYHKRAYSLYNSGSEELSPVFTDAVGVLRDDYIRHLKGDTLALDNEKRAKLAESLGGDARKARAALAEAADSHRRTMSTLADLAHDFVDDELISRYEIHHSPRMSKIFHDLKLGE